jgi:FAD synthase
MKRTALFIGKFNPFHEGHKFILDYLLENFSYVKLGIKREIDLKELNQFKKQLKGIYGFKIEVITMGWFDIIAHGRKTGYSFDRIPTPKDIEIISSSKIKRMLKEEENNK